MGYKVDQVVNELAYSLVLGLLFLVTLLVSGSLAIVGLALGLGKGLPLVAKHLADLACIMC